MYQLEEKRVMWKIVLEVTNVFMVEEMVGDCTIVLPGVLTGRVERCPVR